MTQTQGGASAAALADAVSKTPPPSGLSMSIEGSGADALLVFKGLRGSGKPGRAARYLATPAMGGQWAVLDASGAEMDEPDAAARAEKCGAAAAARAFRANAQAALDLARRAPCVGMPKPARQARLARLAAHSPIENTPYAALSPEARAMVDSADAMVRREAASMGFALERLADDESPWVRREVRDQGFALDSGWSFADPAGCLSADWLEANGMDVYKWREEYPERRAEGDSAFARRELASLDAALDAAAASARELAARVDGGLPAAELASIAGELLAAAQRAEAVEASQAARRAELQRAASPSATSRVQRATARTLG